MTTIESNRLIAEFMGYEIYTSEYKLGRKVNPIFVKIGRTDFTLKQLKYHSSWDWLIPVLKKIKSLDVDMSTWRMITHPLDYDIEMVSKQSAEFIQWYNKNN